MSRWAKVAIYVLGVLGAVGAVSYVSGAPATLVQILNGSTVVSGINPLPVSPSAPSGTQDINLKQVNGAVTTAFGGGVVGNETLRVTITTDTTAKVSVASGQIASGAVASGAYASGSISDGADVTQGAKTDAKSTATDGTSITIMQVLKELSFIAQTPSTVAAGSAKAEDALAVTGDTGVAGLVLQQAAPTDNAGDGDYASPQISGGFAWSATRSTSTTVSTTITRPSDTIAYAANDAFSNSTSSPTVGGFTLTSACRASGGYGTITDAIITASASTAYQGEIWIFDQAVTAVNDNVAFTITDGEAQTLVGVIPFTTNDITAANAISYITGLKIGFACVGTANLRFLVKIMAAVTPASAEVLSVRVKVNN